MPPGLSVCLPTAWLLPSVVSTTRTTSSCSAPATSASVTSNENAS
ncbi:Uncharacterised protein [Mycobacteroides abscessus]|nr:Uncharacterised protein [Mycobacteroides abscessus]